MVNIDVNENELYKKYPRVLDLLLYDNTTKKNIIWATDSYSRRGYRFNDNIIPYNIIKTKIITPRSKKSKAEQNRRSKDNGEVFTPSWMCNIQNNQIDEAWFNRKEVFNIEKSNTWIVTDEKVTMPSNKTWIDYIKDLRLEISCGEAPYIVSRYDTVTGEYLNPANRIGLLDRKFRIIKENYTNKEEWIKYSLEALKATYAFEWQGDNLILARENVLFSYIDYYKEEFNEEPSEDLLVEVATIISCNIWQMDGIKGVIPNSCNVKKMEIANIFGEVEVVESGCDGCCKGDIRFHNGINCKIMDWQKNKKIYFKDLFTGGFMV